MAAPLAIKEERCRVVNFVVGCFYSGKAAVHVEEGVLQISMLVCKVVD